MLKRLAWIIMLAALVLSTSCGRKGPLYLPDQPADDISSPQDKAPRDVA